MVRHGNQSPAAADADGLAPALHLGEAVTQRQPQGIACRTSPFRVVIAHLCLVIPSGSGPIPSSRTDVENVYVAFEKFDFNATSRASHWDCTDAWRDCRPWLSQKQQVVALT